jgi:hypothetical protein
MAIITRTTSVLESFRNLQSRKINKIEEKNSNKEPLITTGKRELSISEALHIKKINKLHEAAEYELDESDIKDSDTSECNKR